MSTGLLERTPFSIEPISYPVIAERIGELAAEYMPLRINGLDDAKGLKVVHEARMVVKNLRVNVEKRRKELKASALEYGRQVDSAAKSLTDLLEPIESHLEAEEDAVTKEKERIKREAEEAKRLKLQKRLDTLMQYGVVGSVANVEPLTDEAFNLLVSRAKSEFEARQAAEAAAALKQKQEAERLAAERAELDRQRKEQEAERAKLEAERRAIELENAKREAAEKARIETEQRIAREQEHAKALKEAAEKRAQEEAAAKEAARLKAEAERPHREKILAVAEAVAALVAPEGPKHDAVALALEECAGRIRAIANGKL